MMFFFPIFPFSTLFELVFSYTVSKMFCIKFGKINKVKNICSHWLTVQMSFHLWPSVLDFQLNVCMLEQFPNWFRGVYGHFLFGLNIKIFFVRTMTATRKNVEHHRKMFSKMITKKREKKMCAFIFTHADSPPWPCACFFSNVFCFPIIFTLDVFCLASNFVCRICLHKKMWTAKVPFLAATMHHKWWKSFRNTQFLWTHTHTPW